MEPFPLLRVSSIWRWEAEEWCDPLNRSGIPIGTHETSIEVDRPVRTVYKQWTQFSFRQFMKGVEAVQRLDDTHTHWVVSLGGAKREFDADTTEQSPDNRIAWKSTNGPAHAGVVTFHHIDNGHTKVTLQLGDKPDGLVEKAGEALGVVGHEVKGDLERFKTFI